MPSSKRAHEQIASFVEPIALEFHGRPYVATNSDRSVDGEVLLRLEGERLDTAVIAVQSYIRENNLLARLPARAWIAIGLRWEPAGRTPKTPRGPRGRKPPKKLSPEIDSVSGLGQLFTSYYQKDSMPTADAVAVDIGDTLRRKRYAKEYEQLLIRVHWSPTGKQPPRPRKVQ